MKDYYGFDQDFLCKSFSFPHPQDIATSKIRHLHCLPISALDISYNTDSSNVRMPLMAQCYLHRSRRWIDDMSGLLWMECWILYHLTRYTTTFLLNQRLTLVIFILVWLHSYLQWKHLFNTILLKKLWTHFLPLCCQAIAGLYH